MVDTCVISEMARPRPDKRVAAWLSRCEEEALFLSVLTLGEIQKGIAKLEDSRRRTRIQHWLDSELRRRFAGRILPIDEEAALTWGVVQGEVERHGVSIPAVDGLLAATAIAHNLTVVTRNEQDMRPTGARILNPWEV